MKNSVLVIVLILFLIVGVVAVIQAVKLKRTTEELNRLSIDIKQLKNDRFLLQMHRDTIDSTRDSTNEAKHEGFEIAVEAKFRILNSRINEIESIQNTLVVQIERLKLELASVGSQNSADAE